MGRATYPDLQPGRVYRTYELRHWGSNPTRLARRLVQEGKLYEAAHGLYYVPTPSRFGLVPPSDEELLRAFLGGSPFLLTGPPYWNALGLGATALFAVTLVYNTRRTGKFMLAGRYYLLRRVCFPARPFAEWYIIDLLENHEMAGIALSDLRQGLLTTLRQGLWNCERLCEMANTYGTRATQVLVEDVLRQAEATS